MQIFKEAQRPVTHQHVGEQAEGEEDLVRRVAPPTQDTHTPTDHVSTQGWEYMYITPDRPPPTVYHFLACD